MDKLKMHTSDKTKDNIKKIAELFPEVLTEAAKGFLPDGSPIVEPAINFDALCAELSDALAGSGEERYEFTWPGKKRTIMLARAPTYKTIRPRREESVNFDDTENLFIEGDNLEALKLLQKAYSGKIKVIYIDPPYNTGNEFIYTDDFRISLRDYISRCGQGEYSGRMHSDWLNMMYPRLIVARDLLREDGVIFVSIDDTEMANTVKIMNEIFGERNKVAELVVIRSEGGGIAKQVVRGHDYLLVYAKNISKFTPLARPKEIRGKVIEKDGEKYWIQEDWLRKKFSKYGSCHYEEILEYKGEKVKKQIDEKLKKGEYVLVPKPNGMHIVGKLRNIKKDTSKFYSVLKHLSATGIKDLAALGLDGCFDYPKPLSLLKEIILGATYFTACEGDIVLDFFAGSATTAHAVMQLNAEDGGNRKFIMVQLPEPCGEQSVAYKAGFKTVADIGKERIRRAGKKILEERPELVGKLDVGFRVLFVDSGNVMDAYFTRSREETGGIIFIKEGRTHEDLLFWAMLELGVPPSGKISMLELAGKKVYEVDNGKLFAFFDGQLTAEVVKEIACRQPDYAVFCDEGAFIKIEQIFADHSPSTKVKLL